MKAFYVIGLLCLLGLAGCGGTEETTNNVPTPTDPGTTDPGDFNPPPAPGTDGRLPAWITKTVALRLTNPQDYTGLQEIAAPDVLYTPPLGDPGVAMELSGGRNQTMTGKFMLAYEDSAGFWGLEIPSFERTGVRRSNGFDIIFSDRYVTIYVSAQQSGDDLSGVVLYRVRQNGETACQTRQSCNYWGVCQPVDSSQECVNYMQPGNPRVKTLGSFQAKYSKWVVQQ